MTDGTQIIPIRHSSPSHGFRDSPAANAMAVEVAKCLKLVAPATMGADAQLSWIASAVEALEGIRAEEVRNVSVELRRSVTRPAQIVPEIARLVAERRQRQSVGTGPDNSQAAAERRINEGFMDRIGRANCQPDVEEASRWERRERLQAGLKVQPLAPPLTRDELDHLPKHIAELGLANGFLERRDGKFYEVTI